MSRILDNVSKTSDVYRSPSRLEQLKFIGLSACNRLAMELQLKSRTILNAMNCR
jgi:hypothetical protein